jgi:hypothetical protein
MYYNSIFGLAVTMIAATVSGNFAEAANYEVTPKFLLALAALITVSMLLNFSTVLSVTANSPLSTAIAGCLKDVLGTVFGIVFFDVEVTFNFALGLSLSLIGACHFSYVKYKNAVEPQDHRKE